ncbi:Receptor-like protein [Melia azedarach]|uniref:Receptor-like protein n=1 Tax=Melia azedarach TaxID=155640 RepID=A0ACC1Z380_MELAZ|nr:Receptor-like protein [Melia azedarach]
MRLSLSYFATTLPLLSSFLLFAHVTSSISPVCHDNERFALLQFKDNFFTVQSASENPSAYPKVRSWNVEEENSNCCSWDGIKCDEDTGHVIRLNLTSSCLYGSIHSGSSLFHLAHLQWLSLSDNHFNFSEIPSKIMNLSRLTHLYLSRSHFSGQIPAELLALSTLEVLDLSLNDYYLKLQNPGLANLAEKLTNLKALDLTDVNISSTVPHTLANLSSLIYLSLSECLLRGEFPAEIFQLPNLKFLGLMYNRNLTGHLPDFQKSNPLEVLGLSYTRFSGKIPDSIENLESLSHLEVSVSLFSGRIPASLGNLTKLEYLDLSNNAFSGELPASLGNLHSLKTLALVSYNFSGKLPSSLGNLTQLNSLLICGGNFSGLNSFSLSWMANLKELTYLDLSLSNLQGEIPSVFMNLTKLTNLRLGYNHLTGPIPSWLMNLNKLSVLFLQSNQLIGHILVEIGNLTQMRLLTFALNQLEGSIPSSIFQLKNVQWLDFYSNNLSGTLDLNMFLLNFKSLDTLVLSSNKLSLLDETIVNTNFQKFRVIELSSCNLSKFPYFLHNQDRLMGLDLSSNKITGQVPKWLLNLTANTLEYLNLSSNLLTGFEQDLLLPPFAALTSLDMRYNKLQGPLPVPSVYAYSYLVSYNQLTGEIPTWVCLLPNLRILDLSYNHFGGMLPECLGNFSHELSILRLQSNNFDGSMPDTFMKGTNLMMIDLSNNSLQGRIPQSLANCVKLKFLNLGNNQITDIFPSWLGTLPELQVFSLKFNKFHGVIKEPKTSFEFPKLRIIDLSHNRFEGNLPSKYFEGWNAMKDAKASSIDYSLTLSNKGREMEYERVSNLIAAIILSNNEFMGEIPTSIANLKGLRALNLSNNNLQGHIPSSLGNLTVLESLDLSNNKLSGEIPQQLGELTTLAVFDVSHNHLTGLIPRGKQFSTFENGSFDGNSGLCGEPLSKKCEDSETSQKEEDRGSESLFAFGWKTVVIGYGSGTIIGVILGHIFSTRKQDWLAKTFRLRLKTTERKRRGRN